MEDLRLGSTVSDGSLGDRLKRLRSQKCDLLCSSHSPKFRSREVSVALDFPDYLSGFGRNIEQKKANDDNVCERDYGSCYRDSEPNNTGLACDFEDGNVEPVSQGPVMANAFADEEFVARSETLDVGNACTIDSRSIMNQMTVNIKVEDGGYPQLGNENSGLIMNSRNLPKRRKVSAVRDFPDAFQHYNGHNGSRKKVHAIHDFPDASQQCNGQNGSEKKASAHRDFPDAFKQECNGKNSSQAVQVDFDDLNGASKVDDKLEPTKTDFLPLRNPQLRKEHIGLIMDTMNLPKRPKVSAVRDFPDAFQQYNGPNDSRKKAYVGAVQVDFDDLNGASEVDDKLEPTKTDFLPIRNPQLVNEHSGLKMDSMNLPKRRKVSAVRDFPDAFQQYNGPNDSRKKESVWVFHDAFQQCNRQIGSQKKAIISFDANDVSKVEDDLEPTKTDFMPQRNTAETEDDLLNLSGQELICAPGKEKVLKLPADLLDSEELVASITPTLQVSEWNEKAKHIIPLAIQEHDYAEVISQDAAAKQSKLENDRDGKDFYSQLEISKPVKQDRVQVGACLQLNHKKTSTKMHHKVSAVRDFPVAFKLREEQGSGSDFSPVREIVNPKISLEQGKVKSFTGHHLVSKESEHRRLVQALMAAPRCPWRSKKSRGSKGKHTGKKEG